MIILIPAYEPDEKLVRLIDALDLALSDVGIVVVDDGSGPAYRDIFRAVEARGCDVLGHIPNRGKGHALKRGFAHIAANYPGQDVVCADSDGQHLTKDILRVADAVADAPDTTMVLGARHFTGRVPLRSRFGNTVTRGAFWMATGRHVTDTQTGLRGYPAAMLAWLATVPGERFEYELNLLLQARRAGYQIAELPIDTVYLEGNASSHFRPLVDSVRIYAPLLRFAASSLAGFGLDFVALLGLHALTGNLLASVVGARLLSATANFALNRRLVFNDGPPRSLVQAAARYGALAGVVLLANYALMWLLTGVGLPLVVAKIVTETVLFALSYAVQRAVVYTERPTPEAAPAEVRTLRLGA